MSAGTWRGGWWAWLGWALLLGSPGLFLVFLPALGPVTLVMVLALAGATLVVRTELRRPRAVRAEESISLLRADVLAALSMSEARRELEDRPALREALLAGIDGEIACGRFDEARALIDRFEAITGSGSLAAERRVRLDVARAASAGGELSRALAQFESLLARGLFDLATADAARIAALFPGEPRAHGLGARVGEARSRRHRELEESLRRSSASGDVKGGLAALRALDSFLTPEEAAPIRETAREVLARARDELAARFTLAVRERRLDEAEDLSARLAREFPNTKAAVEAREVLERLSRGA